MSVYQTARLKLLEIYCETRIDLLLRKWSWMLAAFIYSWHDAWQARFYRVTFALLAKMASADKNVSQEELAAVEEFTDSSLRLNPRQKAAALRAFRNARESATPFEQLAKDFYTMYRHNRAMREMMFVTLLAVAYADARRCGAEDRLIEVARWVFCIDPARALKLKERYVTSELLRQRLHDLWRSCENKSSRAARYRSRIAEEQPKQQPAAAANGAAAFYRVLGASPSDPPSVIKRRYRTLVLKYHPDRIRAQGLGEERAAEFQARFRAIQEAYETIMKSHEGRVEQGR